MIRDRIFDGLTFDDILLVPGYAEIHPSEVSLKSKLTRKLECNIPLLSAAMDTVTEADTAICMAQEGGLGGFIKTSPSKNRRIRSIGLNALKAE